MSNYVFIESRDPFESADTSFLADTAASLKKRGNNVTVFLVQNGVLVRPRTIAPARRSRATAVASSAAGVSGRDGHPTRVAIPVISKLSLTVTGTP